jgi:copper chaperone CopZ
LKEKFDPTIGMADTEICYTGGPAPPWLDKNAWYIPVQVPKEHVEKLPRIGIHKVELKVQMCCKKCAEIVTEEIRYLGGVFDVKVDQKAGKVTVTGRPDRHKVLKRARKVDKNATFWPEPPPPPAPPVVVVVEEKPKEPEKPQEEKKEEEKPKEEEKKEEEKPKEEEKKEEKKEEEKPKEEEKKEEEKPKEEEKKEEKKEEEKKEEAAPAPVAAQVQFPPYEYATFEGYPGPFGFEYRPSQDYQRLYPGDYNTLGYFGPQVPYLNPNYLKHVKIAY